MEINIKVTPLDVMNGDRFDPRANAVMMAVKQAIRPLAAAAGRRGCWIEADEERIRIRDDCSYVPEQQFDMEMPTPMDIAEFIKTERNRLKPRTERLPDGFDFPVPDEIARRIFAPSARPISE